MEDIPHYNIGKDRPIVKTREDFVPPMFEYQNMNKNHSKSDIKTGQKRPLAVLLGEPSTSKVFTDDAFHKKSKNDEFIPPETHEICIEPSQLLEIQLEDVQNDDDDNTKSNIKIESVTENTDVEGKRIIDIQYFYERLQEIALHNSSIGCSFNHLRIVSEKLDGLQSQLNIHCSNCDSNFQVPLNDNSTKEGNINSALVTRAMNLGIGFEHLNQFFNTVGVPIMNKKYESPK